MLQAISAGLNCHAPGHLRHRREQRQTTSAGGDGFIGDTGSAAVDQLTGLLGIGREMQIGKQHLALAQHRAFHRLRLLDLDYHFGAREDVCRVIDDFGADRRILDIADPDAFPALVSTSTW